MWIRNLLLNEQQHARSAKELETWQKKKWKSKKSGTVPGRQERKVLADWEARIRFLSVLSPRFLTRSAFAHGGICIFVLGLGFKSRGDHTAPGRQPLSSNPLPNVMTLSNLDHLLKHVPKQSAPRCVKNPTPLPNHRPAAGWLLAARRQGQGHSTAQRETHTHTHSRSHHCLHPTLTQTLYEMRARKTPSHRNLRGRVGRGEWVEEEGEGSKQERAREGREGEREGHRLKS